MTATTAAAPIDGGRARERATIDVRVHASIDEIDPAVWDAILAPDDLQATHRFVRACERARIEEARYRHVVVTAGGGVQAIATFCEFRVGLDVLATGLTRRALAAVRRVWPGALRVPVVFGGLPVSFGRSCLRIAPGADAPAVLDALCRVADDFAAETRAPVVCFKEFTAAESARLAPLLGRGYLRVPSLPGCRLELTWRRGDEWSAAMRAPYRRQLLAARRHASDRGLTVRHTRDWRGVAPAIHALYDQVIARAEIKLERLPAAFFTQLSTLGPESHAILVEHRGALVAAAIVLDGPTESAFLVVGMDYASAPALGAYHAVVDEVVQHAIRRGAGAVELGQTSYDHKMRLGAVTTSRDLYLRCRSPLGHRLLAAFRGALFPVVVPRPRRVFRDGVRAEGLGGG